MTLGTSLLSIFCIIESIGTNSGVSRGESAAPTRPTDPPDGNTPGGRFGIGGAVQDGAQKQKAG